MRIADRRIMCIVRPNQSFPSRYATLSQFIVGDGVSAKERSVGGEPVVDPACELVAAFSVARSQQVIHSGPHADEFAAGKYCTISLLILSKRFRGITFPGNGRLLFNGSRTIFRWR